jgi:hypothetical protein
VVFQPRRGRQRKAPVIGGRGEVNNAMPAYLLLKNLSLASHFGHATVFGFERFDVLIEGVMAALSVISPLRSCVIVFVKNAERIVSLEFREK